jgi:hypothetical protein
MIRLFFPRYFPGFLGLRQGVQGPLPLMWMRLGKQVVSQPHPKFLDKLILYGVRAPFQNWRRAEEVGNESEG